MVFSFARLLYGYGSRHIEKASDLFEEGPCGKVVQVKAQMISTNSPRIGDTDSYELQVGPGENDQVSAIANKKCAVPVGGLSLSIVGVVDRIGSGDATLLRYIKELER